MTLLTALKVPCAPIYSMSDVLAHSQTEARGMVMDYDHPGLGPLKTVAQPILFDGDTRAVRLPPPMHGEHSRAVLAEPGYCEDEVADLVRAGTIVESASG